MLPKRKMDPNRTITTTLQSVLLFFDLSQRKIGNIANFTKMVELDPIVQPMRAGSSLDF